MIKYVPKPKNFDDWYEDEERPRGEVVYENTDAVPTGLFDVHGNEIMRINQFAPIGFRFD